MVPHIASADTLRPGMTPDARDGSAAARFWDISRELTGIDIDSVLARTGGVSAR